MKISASLIVKNEEATLGRCLESIRSHVDEIVVVDTGSSDRTKDLARRYSTRLYDCPWTNDFAAARQCSFDLACGDWIFWVDADDVVQNADRIRPSLSAIAPEVNCFHWKYQVGRDDYGHSTCEFWRERCVRNNGSFRWVGRVHEVLLPRSGRAVSRRNHETLVVHARETRQTPRNPTRNIELLQFEYARPQQRPSPRLLYCLGNEYADLCQNDLAIEFLERYVRVSQWSEEKYFALMRTAELYRVKGQFREAVDAARRASKIQPTWPNAFFSIAETYYFLKDWNQVVHWTEIGRQLPLPETVCVINPHALRYSWIVYYTNALFHVGRIRDALEWTEKALEVCPRDAWHLKNRDFFSKWIAADHELKTSQA